MKKQYKVKIENTPSGSASADSVLRSNLDRIRKVEQFLHLYIKHKHVNLIGIKHCDIFFEDMRKSLKHKGSLYTINGYKTARLDVLRHLSGSPLPIKEHREIWYKRNKLTGLPSSYKYFGDIKSLSTDEKRVLLTLVFTGRGLKATGKSDYSTINEHPDVGLNPRLMEYIDWMFPEPIFSKEDLKPGTCHLSTTMGPTGPAMKTSLDELHVLSDDDKEDLYYLCNDKRALLAEFFKTMPKCDLGAVKEKYKDSMPLRRLSELQDKEGKVRLVAIFDYWSQSVLKPLHERLNEFLRTLKEDCTFNQNNFKEILTHECFGKENIYSIDLTAATDLMPVSIQAYVLEKMIGDQDYADTWLRVLTGKEFLCSDGEHRSYSVGQPMGAYSSGPMMAITHHILIRFSAALVGKPAVYWVLGDDALIVGDDVYRAYRKILAAHGMSVNESKTFVSKDMFEFAKRFYFKGEEISPYPVEAIINSRGEYPLLAVAIDNAVTKSLHTEEEMVDKARVVVFFSEILAIFGADPYKCRGPARKLYNMLNTIELCRWLENDGGLYRRPKGLTSYSISCHNATHDGPLKAKMRYIFQQAMSDIAKEMYKQGMGNYLLNTSRLRQHDSLLQEPSHENIGSLDLPLHPIQVMMEEKNEVLKEIASNQYNENRARKLDGTYSIEVLREQGATRLSDLTDTIPEWDSYDNEKGSVKRSRMQYKFSDKVRSLLKEFYDMTL